MITLIQYPDERIVCRSLHRLSIGADSVFRTIGQAYADMLWFNLPKGEPE